MIKTKLNLQQRLFILKILLEYSKFEYNIIINSKTKT